MTIRARLNIALGLLMAVIVAMSAVALLSAARTRQTAHEPADHLRHLRTFYDFGDAVSRLVKELNDVAQDGEDDNELLRFAETARAALDRVERESSVSADAEGRALAVDLRAVHDRIARDQQRILVMVAHGELDDARTLAIQVGEEVYEGDFVSLMTRANDRESAAADATLRRGVASARRTGYLALGLAVISAIIMLAAWLTVRRIQSRLSALVGVVTRMGQGDLETRSADVVSSDELGNLGLAVNHMANNLEHMIGQIAGQQAIVQEMALASRLQQAILPRSPSLPGLEIHGEMTTATDVGGDYYDVIPAADGGGWIAIGDVSGHGVNAGIVMLMAQSAIAAAVRAHPTAGPAAALCAVNHVLYENVRTRIGRREYMTLSLLRYHPDGRIVHAGAHLEMLVRTAGGELRTVPTRGVWMGIMSEPDRHLVESELVLAPGDTLVLHTDGITEAIARDGGLFGFERLRDAVSRGPDGAAALCRDVLSHVRAEIAGFDDDATLVVVHRPAPAVAVAAAA